MERVAVDIGHNSPANTGAVGFRKEDELTKAVGTKVITYLKQLGYKVTDCTPVNPKTLGQDLALRVTTAATSRAEFFLSIHFNAGGGQGVEAYAMSQKGREIAGKLCSDVSNLGFKNRGVKDGSHLYVIRNTSMVAVLLEVAFVDTKSDMELYENIGADKIAQTIVTSITGKKPMVNVENIEKKVEGWLNSMDIKALQHVLNVLGIRDKNGNTLTEDGIEGALTQSAKVKAKEVLTYIIK